VSGQCVDAPTTEPKKGIDMDTAWEVTRGRAHKYPMAGAGTRRRGGRSSETRTQASLTWPPRSARARGFVSGPGVRMYHRRVLGCFTGEVINCEKMQVCDGLGVLGRRLVSGQDDDRGARPGGWIENGEKDIERQERTSGPTL
jgi:hypothetical protein